MSAVPPKKAEASLGPELGRELMTGVRPVTVQRVLTVDDDPTVRAWISALLRRLGVEVVEAASGEEALALLEADESFDLLLLDVNLPHGMDGCAVAGELARLRGPDDAGIPIIFLTGNDRPEDKLRAFAAGAVDYVLKPFEPEELLARVRSVLRTRTLVDQLERQATTDQLTGLLNRSALGDELEACRRRLDVDPTAKFGMLFLDLDRFKPVNDSLGHHVGDALLCHVAEQVRGAVRDPASPEPSWHLVARNGGDEFVVVLRGIADAAACERAAQRILRAIETPTTLGGHRLRVGASVGIRWVERSGEQLASLLRDADTAMYEAKRAGRGRAVVFEDWMRSDALARLETESQILEGIEREEFVLHYQPLLSTQHNRLEKFEALVRWEHPTRGLLLPQAFIPLAEESGLILALGAHVMELACRQLGEWIARYGVEATPPMNVNVAPDQLLDEGFCVQVRDTLARHAVPARLLGLEVTESTLVGDADRARTVLKELKEMGLTLSVDDFGTGYSSLATLRSFPFDVIKVDRAFVQSMARDRSCGGIIQAIVGLAWNLNMSVVAEGAESPGEIAQLIALEVDFIQGYGVSRPVPIDVAENMVRCANQPFFKAGFLDGQSEGSLERRAS